VDESLNVVTKYPVGFVCSEIEGFDGWIVIQGYFVDCVIVALNHG
jgi:hypothetical protein